MFPPVFVINLPHQKERMQKVKENLDGLGIAYTRVEGVYGKDVPDANKTPLCSMFCTHGMVGCYKSHVNIWSMVCVSSHPCALVLEDDVQLTQASKHVIEKLTALMHHDDRFEIISLWSFTHFLPKPCLEGVTVSAEDGRQYRLCSNPFPLSTAGYLISHRTTCKLLEKLGKSPSYHVDFVLALHKVFGNIQYYTIAPNLLKLNGFHDSSIVEKLNTNANSVSYVRYFLWIPVLSMRQHATICVGHLILAHLILALFTISTIPRGNGYPRKVAVSVLILLIFLFLALMHLG